MTSSSRARRSRSSPIPAYPQALGGPPDLTRLTFLVGRDPESLLEDYRAGELDAVVDFPATMQPAYAAVPGTTTVASPAVGFHELGFNCWESARSKGDPLLRDASIRRAVHWAIDKDKIVATAMAGLAEPGTSLLSPAQGDWHWEVPKDAAYRYDPRAPSRSSRTPGTPTATATASARTRPAASSRSGSSPSTSTRRTRTRRG